MRLPLSGGRPLRLRQFPRQAIPVGAVHIQRVLQRLKEFPRQLYRVAVALKVSDPLALLLYIRLAQGDVFVRHFQIFTNHLLVHHASP